MPETFVRPWLAGYCFNLAWTKRGLERVARNQVATPLVWDEELRGQSSSAIEKAFASAADAPRQSLQTWFSRASNTANPFRAFSMCQ
jgi:hypothetical protein